MGRKKIPGLRRRGAIWHIEKQIRGYGILRESTGADNLAEAERYLIMRLEQIRQTTVYGVRPVRLFKDAAAKFLMDNQDMRSIHKAAEQLKLVMPYIGDLPLERVHDGTLAPFVAARTKLGRKPGTINMALSWVRNVLNQAARKWRDENGLTWLAQAPAITALNAKRSARQPYPLSRDEQRLFFAELKPHLQEMALFKVNTGTREQEVCGLRWDWEQYVPELGRSVFVVPGELVKNAEDRLIILNDVAWRIIESRRGKHPVYVFSYCGRRLVQMNNNGWRGARARAAKRYTAEFGEPAPDGFARIRVHDLKHTFGRRLRAAGVPLETRKVLLGHTNGDITTHYSAPELAELLEAANRVCGSGSGKTPPLTLIRVKKP